MAKSGEPIRTGDAKHSKSGITYNLSLCNIYSLRESPKENQVSSVVI